MPTSIPGCNDLAHIRTTDLVAALDGEAAAAMVQHLHRCDACQQAALELRDELALLHALAPRLRCPSAEAWLLYHEQMLDAAMRQQMASHLQMCSACRAELTDLAAVTLDLPAPTLLDRLRASGQRILEALPQRSPALPLPVVRGEPTEQTLAYQVEGFQLTLSYTPALAGGAGSLRGMLRSAAGVLPQPARVTLQQELQSLAEDLVDEFGYFSLDQVRPGCYQLVLTLPEVCIVIAALHLPHE